MNSTTAIANILGDLTDGYLRLRDLLDRERQSLQELDGLAVGEISKEKDTILFRIRLLEEERLRLIRKFAQENPEVGRPAQLNLKRIIEVTGDAALGELRSRLVGVIHVCSEMNAVNKVLIERSLQYVRNSSKFFDSVGIGSMIGRPGTLISRET